jgi:L,D-transpeptidase catalytic domain
MAESSRIALAAALLALGGAVVAGCGATRQVAEPGAGRPHRAAPLAIPKHSLVHHSCRAATAVEPTPTRSFAALVRTDAAIRRFPSGGRVLARVGRIDPNGYPTVLGIVGSRTAAGACRPDAYRVQLPVPPNMRTGWIPARAVHVFSVGNRIVVDLSKRLLVAYRDGTPALRARVAIGAPQTPTPIGRYFVNERWLLASGNGPFGIAALGISAHSNVLHDWVQDGPIALHGTNEPSMIGRAISHGCVRLTNDDMQRLLKLAPAGTPVVIRR